MGSCLERPVPVIVVIGVSDAGKTTLINRLEGKPDSDVMPSIFGSSCTYETKRGTVRLVERPGFGWGRPGQTKHILSNRQLRGIICVVNASRSAEYFLDAPDETRRDVHNDPETGCSHWDAGTVLFELHDVLRAPITRGLPLLVVANKYDDGSPGTITQIAQQLSEAAVPFPLVLAHITAEYAYPFLVPLEELTRRLKLDSIANRAWNILPLSAKTGWNMQALTEWLETIVASGKQSRCFSPCRSKHKWEIAGARRN